MISFTSGHLGAWINDSLSKSSIQLLFEEMPDSLFGAAAATAVS
jgi:hypothetical protein